MSTATKVHIGESKAVMDQASIAEAVRAAHDASRPICPVGGGTSLDYGNPPSRPGDQLDLAGLNRVLDYTPRDMTIFVEAGLRMADLAATLAAEGQHLPIDVPRASEATIGGVVATNWNGPRRLGHGTIRDYVIGIHAVDGRGTAFKGGGRVVKNVAGYDFCKLLTGSLGTLAVITQLALKVKPLPESHAAVVAEFGDLNGVEQGLARLSNLPAPPVAIDLLVGGGWKPNTEGRHQVIVRVEGTQSEIAWLATYIQDELKSQTSGRVCQLDPTESAELWRRQIEFSHRGAADSPDDAPLVVKIAVPPSAVTNFVATLLQIDPACAIQAHAGNGIIVARFSKFGHNETTSVLGGKLRPAAVKLGGSLVVVSSTLTGLTPHLLWGGRTEATVLMERIKHKFDPRNILNPGRFVFP